MLYLSLTVIGILLNLGIGLFVLAQDKGSKLNRSVFLLAFSLGLWLVSNYLSDNTTGTAALYWNRSSFIGPILALYFSRSFISGLKAKPPTAWQQRIEASLTIFFGVYALLGNVISSVNPRIVDGELAGNDVTRGVAYYVVIAWIVYLLVTFIISLSTTLQHATGKLREQLNVILLGVTMACAIGMVTNVFIPLLSDSTASARLAPLTGIVIIATFAYAIVRHGFLDIRSFVVRAAVYVLSTSVLAVLYVAPLMYLVAIIIMGFDFVLPKFIAGVVVGTIAALNYSKLRRWFDGITSRIFFQDRYDSAVLLGELNRTLVSSVDITRVLHSSAGLIVKNLKSEFCYFVLQGKHNKSSRIIGIGSRKLSPSDANPILNHVDETLPGIIDTNFLSPAHERLKKTLNKNDVAVLIRLAGNAQDDTDSIGYMLLGYKKSGKPYDPQDRHTLETMGDVLIIAIQNALHFEEIQNFNITLQRTVEERTAQLRRTNAKLKALDETKDDFISMASHQLRTPLTSVKGYLSMVLEGDAGKLTAVQRKMLDQAFVSSQRMVFLIADLLNVSRLKTGKFVIEPVKVNLADIVEGEVKQLQETAKGRSLELAYNKPADFPELMLDETKIRQVVMNFIDNAIYYTPTGGRIDVELTDTPVSVKLFVKDNGIGVPRGEQPHLFTKFYRAGNARRARPDGTGLGLFMAKKVIVASGGAVVFESKEGKGSTFGFIFPKAKLEVPKAKPLADTVAA